MMKRTVTVLLVAVTLSTAIFGQDRDLNQRESIDLAGIETVEFDLRRTKVVCVICVNTLTIDSQLSGDGVGNAMTLSLEGRVSSNRAQAVPEITVENTGKRVTVRLSLGRERSFRRSRLSLTARLPSAFSGELIVIASSDDIAIARFDLEKIDIRATSGDLRVDAIRSGSIDIRATSGDLWVDAIRSGSIALGVTSGDLWATELESPGAVTIGASSGDITIERISARGAIRIEATSGDVTIGMAALERPVRIDVSSGDVVLGLPPEVGFDARLEVGSGRIRSDFSIIGETTGRGDDVVGKANGGGVPVEIRTSSGDIALRAR